MFKKVSEKAYCAFCRLERRVYRKRHLSPINIFLSLFTSLLIMVILYQSFDPRVLFIFVCCAVFAEAFIQIRWRVSISCPHCGFDPVLYLKNQNEAAERVKEFLETRKNSPRFWLSSKNPFKMLPKRKKEHDKSQKTSSSERRLSKQV